MLREVELDADTAALRGKCLAALTEGRLQPPGQTELGERLRAKPEDMQRVLDLLRD